MVDIAASVEARSDQQNFDDYQAGPKTVTVAEVRQGTAEQPVEVHLVEFPGKPYKPSKSMRRVLIAGWGADSSLYAGRQLTLFGDPSVRFGKAEVGGIKISHLSHIPTGLRINLTVSRGKREPYRVEPLVTASSVAPPDGWEADVAGCETVDEIQEFYVMAKGEGWWSPVVKTACAARRKALEDAAV